MEEKYLVILDYSDGTSTMEWYEWGIDAYECFEKAIENNGLSEGAVWMKCEDGSTKILRCMVKVAA